MLIREATIKNKVGMHARPVSLLSKCAQQFESEIIISRGEKAANANSVLKLMLLQAKCGDQIIIRAEGKDEEKAMDAILELIQSGFGEE